MGKDYWKRVIDFEFLVEQGAITEADTQLFKIVDNAEEAWSVLEKSWG